jgi:hypothetical protein
MRSPAEYYIKYLLSNPSKSIADIDVELGKLDIPVELKYLEYLANSLKFPRNYSPLDPSHRPTRNFLKKERIYKMWFPDPLVREAVKIYQSPAVRDTVCTALLNGFTPNDVLQIIRQLHKFSAMEESIVEFKHYFWNTDLLTQDELTDLFMRPERPFKTKYLSAMRAPKNHEAGPHVALFNMGIVPKDLETLRMTKAVRDLAYLNICDTSSFLQGRNKSEMFRNYAFVYKDMQKMIDEIEQQSEDVIEEFMRTVQVSERNEDLPLIQDIIDVAAEGEETDGRPN